jgi:hypothetical protein
MDRINVIQDRDQQRDLVNMVMNLRVPQNVDKFLSGFTACGHPRTAQLQRVSFLCPVSIDNILI